MVDGRSDNPRFGVRCATLLASGWSPGMPRAAFPRHFGRAHRNLLTCLAVSGASSILFRPSSPRIERPYHHAFPSLLRVKGVNSDSGVTSVQN